MGCCEGKLIVSFEVLSCTGRDAARWQSLFDQLPLEYRDVFFTPAYARVQQSLGHGQCYAAVYIWQDFFILQPFMQRGCELTSFYGGGGPVSNLAGKADYRLWLWFEQEFAPWRHDNRIVSEYVRLHPLFEQIQRRMLRESTLKVELLREAVSVKIDCDNQALLKSFSRNRQRGIKDAIYAGATVKESTEDDNFAQLYSSSMQRLNAKDSWKYPNNVWDQYWRELGAGYLSFLTAKVRDQVAMLMVLHGYGKAYAHFLAGDNVGLNDLLYYESMKYCRDVGCKTYFLGGGTTSDAGDTLLAYKSGFSSTRVPVYFYRREFSSADSPPPLSEKLDVRV